ncbi:MAG: nitroreductase family protein, partial [Nitrososphaera sp.]
MTAVDRALTGTEKEGLYKAIFSRRDVRSHFVDREIPNDVLARILNAAHHAPSVGFSQPWNFILIKDAITRQHVKESFLSERERSTAMLDGDRERQKKYSSLKLEGIMESAVNICVTYDSTRFGP